MNDNRAALQKLVLILLGVVICALLYNAAANHIDAVADRVDAAANRLRAPQHWEYMITSVPDWSFTLQMNVHGAEGWELVSARRASDGSRYPTFSYEMIFKRPK